MTILEQPTVSHASVLAAHDSIEQTAHSDHTASSKADQAAIDAFIREHPHLQEASPEWQAFYYHIRAAVMKKP